MFFLPGDICALTFIIKVVCFKCFIYSEYLYCPRSIRYDANIIQDATPGDNITCVSFATDLTEFSSRSRSSYLTHFFTNLQAKSFTRPSNGELSVVTNGHVQNAKLRKHGCKIIKRKSVRKSTRTFKPLTKIISIKPKRNSSSLQNVFLSRNSGAWFCNKPFLHETISN